MNCEIYICTFAQPLCYIFLSTLFSEPTVMLFFIEEFHASFLFFFFSPPVSWQCVITTNSCSSAEAFTPTFYVHTVLYQTETPTSEEVGITVGFRRRDSSSGGIFVPSEDNHKPTAGTARAGVEGMTIICIKHIHLSNQFRFLKFLLCVFVTYTPKISGNCLYHLHKVYLC